MYQKIFEKYRAEFSSFPKTRRPRIGSIIKTIRINKGIRQMDFARTVKINESTLKNIENDHQEATTIENLNQCAKALGITVRELILMGREWDPANYFALKRSTPPKIEGMRIRKRAPIEWHENVRLRFKDFDLNPVSAPIHTKKDFFCGRFVIPPKRAIENLALGIHYPVIGFAAEGFNLKILYAGKEHSITNKQAFMADGFFPHTLKNDDDDHAAVIYIITKLPNYEKIKLEHPSLSPSKEPESIHIAQGIESLRKFRSDRPNKLLPVQHLADLTDNLDYQQMLKIVGLKKESSLVYWDKIEDILGAANVPIEDFLDWSYNQLPQPFHLATAATRAHTEYLSEGVRIYHATPPHIDNRFFCGELFVAGKKQNTWKRKDHVMYALYLEEGELEMTVGGKIRSPLPLAKGESIYFDASLGYMLRNPVEAEAKAFIATCPALQL